MSLNSAAEKLMNSLGALIISHKNSFSFYMKLLDN